MDLIMVAQGRNKNLKEWKPPDQKPPGPDRTPSPSRKPATIFRKVNHTVPRSRPPARFPRRSTTDRERGTSSFWPTPIASPRHTARAQHRAGPLKAASISREKLSYPFHPVLLRWF